MPGELSRSRATTKTGRPRTGWARKRRSDAEAARASAPEKMGTRVGVRGCRHWSATCYTDVATREARKASRNDTSDSPVPGEGRIPEQPGQTEKI
jgi:hypothetical protein